MHRSVASLAALAALAIGSSPVLADFTGQTILGPLGPGSAASGDLTGKSDDNDGWDSGTHIFNIWDGGDDVWALNWPGGDMQVDLIYNTALGDPDLFLYTPDNLNESSIYSFANTGVDTVALAGAPAGTYYLNVDTTFFTEGPYDLRVTLTPAPSTLALLGAVGVMGARRRRA